MKRAAYVSITVVTLCAGFLAIVIMARTSSWSAVGDVSDSSLSFQPHPGSRLPLGVNLVDEAGRVVPLGDYFTKTPVIVVLEYLHCTSLCGVTLRHLIADTLGRVPLQSQRDYQVVAISIDPRDKPADAAKARATYTALLNGIGTRGLHFLTGSEAAVRQIADTIGFPYRYDPLLDAYIHPAGFVIAAPDGVISRYLEGVAVTPKELVGAITDAEQQKSQTLLTRLVLLCHVQGAPLGRFTVPVLAAFTLANIIAGLAAIGIFAAIKCRRYG